MTGLKALDIEVCRILWEININKPQPAIFRIWRSRMNSGKLSFEKKLEILATYAPQIKITLTLKHTDDDEKI